MPEDSPVKPLLDLRDRIKNFVRKQSPKQTNSDAKVDTSWHDEMVKRATSSFGKSAQKKVSAPPNVKAAPKKKVVPGKKKTTKR